MIQRGGSNARSFAHDHKRGDQRIHSNSSRIIRGSVSCQTFKIQRLLKKRKIHPLELMSDPGPCQVFVVCVDAQDIRSPTIYASSGPTSLVPIFQCAQATTAAPTYFSPVRIGDRWVADGGLAFNNPTELALTQFGPTIFGPKFPISCVISIGTGDAADIGLQVGGHGLSNAFGILSLLRTLVRLTTSAEVVHERIRASLQNPDGSSPYFRISPDSEGLDAVALDDWKALADLEERAKRYVERDEFQRDIAQCSASLRAGIDGEGVWR